MWPYWVFFAIPATAAVLGSEGRSSSRRLWRATWVLTGICIALFMGGRFEVGGDWFNYVDYFDGVRDLSLVDTLTTGDPGYLLLNWVCVQLKLDLVAVNLIAACIFTYALVRFCLALPRPWLALAIAIPYLVIVVGMGYTRQGVALSLSMLGLLGLRRHSLRAFIFWVLLGATFHKTAVLLLPIAALAGTRDRLWTFAWVGILAVGAYFFLEDSLDLLYDNYVVTEYASEGALVRLAMNAVPAVLVLLFGRRFAFSESEKRVWQWFSVISLALIVVFYFVPASTAIDRIALYLLPLQLVVFSHLPDAFSRKRAGRVWAIAIIAYYSSVLFIWLEFATHSQYWLPYQFAI